MVNRRKYSSAQVITGKVEGWKAALLRVLDISPTEVIDAGLNLILENKVYKGQDIVTALKPYREGLVMEIEERQEKIAKIDFALKDREIKNSAAQLRIWDSALNEERIIPSKQFDPSRHKLKEEIKV